MSQNLISKYLFLEQKAQSLEEVLTFLTKARGSIHIFSESTHIEALIKQCKMMKIKKKSYLYNPIGHGLTSLHTQCVCREDINKLATIIVCLLLLHIQSQSMTNHTST